MALKHWIVASQHQGKIDLVLADVVMPRMSGPDLVTRLKEIRPETKAMLMTGYAEYSGTDSQTSSPQCHILQKPFSIASLVEKIREELSGKATSEVNGVEAQPVT